MKPWLLIPAKWAHKMSPFALKIYAFLFGKDHVPEWRSVKWKDLEFPNPVGIAGGVDKNAENILEWWNLGVGFIEIGTVTPKPQTPNPGSIIDRDLANFALWNKMGFPNLGAKEIFQNLNNSGPEFKTPVFVNIGKNRNTPNEKAHLDYLAVMDVFKPLADAFVINISSPNTQGLRELQSESYLSDFLKPLIEKSNHFHKTPLLLKLSPDMVNDGFEKIVRTAAKLGVDGFILTNTTLSRYSNCPFPSEGGVSGAPLKKLSIEALQKIHEILGDKRKDFLIISVGGVLSYEDIEQRLLLGADLVQIYSGLIFNGPNFFIEVAKEHERRSKIQETKS